MSYNWWGANRARWLIIIAKEGESDALANNNCLENKSGTLASYNCLGIESDVLASYNNLGGGSESDVLSAFRKRGGLFSGPIPSRPLKLVQDYTGVGSPEFV